MKHLPVIIQLLLLIAIVALYIDLRRSGILFANDHTTIINRDSIYLPDITLNVPPGKPIIIYQPAPVIIDTTELIRAYFATKTYADSIKTDSVSFWIDEVISQNSIQSRTIRHRLNIPIQTVTQYHNISKAAIILGGFGSYGKDQINLHISGGLVTKRGGVFFAGYGTDRSITFGYMSRVKR